MTRHATAEKLGVSTSQLRDWEKRRTNTFQHSKYFGECIPVEVPDEIIQMVSAVTEFPVAFFENYCDQDSFKPISFACRNPDLELCTCGEKGTRACDFVIVSREPVYADQFNKIHIVEYKEVSTVCDAAICDKCTERKGEHDLCTGHCSPRHLREVLKRAC